MNTTSAMATGKPLVMLEDHTGQSWIAELELEGQRVVTEREDGAAKTWDAHVYIVLPYGWSDPYLPVLVGAKSLKLEEAGRIPRELIVARFQAACRLRRGRPEWDSVKDLAEKALKKLPPDPGIPAWADIQPPVRQQHH